MTNKCAERNCKNEVAERIRPQFTRTSLGGALTVTDSNIGRVGRVVLPISGEVEFEDWMKGLCVDCIEQVKEFEGEMSETPYSDYMPADAVNREWDSSY